MPRLTDEERERWQRHRRDNAEFWAKIEAKYSKGKKRHFECRLCGDKITVIEPDDMWDAVRRHENSHPEYAEWVALNKGFSILDVPKILHDHDCVFVKCACLCGCKASTCVADMPEKERDKPMLCDLCELYQNRGHVEHRLEGE